nr:hypothetical protein [Tanacetum cinerariifolium]
MDAPPSPNYMFNFPEVEFEEDPQEEPEEEFKEDLKEDPEEDPEVEAEDDVPPPATPPVGSPITPPPLSESSSNTKDIAPVIENEALEMPPIGSTYEVGGPSSVTLFTLFHLHGSEIARLDGNTELLLSNVQYLESCEKKHKVDMETCSSEICEGKKRMDNMEPGLGDEMQFSNVVEHRVTDLENREQEKDEEMVKVKKHLGTLEANYSLVLSDRRRLGLPLPHRHCLSLHQTPRILLWEHEKDEEMVKVKKRLGTLKVNYSLVLSDRDGRRKAFINLQAWVFERLRRGAWDAPPDVGDDGPVFLGSLNLPNHRDLLVVPISLFIITY